MNYRENICKGCRMLKFDNVSKTFAEKIPALNDINFTITNGEFVFLIGSSGAGKTTLLNLINAAMMPSQGNIAFDDFDYAYLTKKAVPMLRRKIGSIFQDYKLLLDRTVEENVKLPLEIVGMKEKEMKEFVDQALKEVGLEGKNCLFPRELSGGEVQRVAIARAIITNPPLLLADEPTADLDEENAWNIVKLLEKVNTISKATVIMATHNQDVVKKMEKRIIRLQDGRIVEDTGSQNEGADTKMSEPPKTKEHEMGGAETIAMDDDMPAQDELVLVEGEVKQ